MNADWMPVLDMPAPTRETQDEIMLEELWKEEPGCQSKHDNPLNPVCSIEVTHLLTWCQGQLLLCENAVRANERYMAWEAARCQGCLQRAGDCWKVYPV